MFTIPFEEEDTVVSSTLLAEYDEQGVELRRTLLRTPGDTDITWRGMTLDVGADGTWMVSGEAWDVVVPTGDSFQWAIAVRAGEILWRYEERPFLETRIVLTATMTDDILFAGYVNSYDLSDRTWALRLDSGTGEVLADVVGPSWPTGGEHLLDGSQYTGSGVTMDGRVRLVGMTNHQDVSQEQWLCTFVN